jgi:hypothetical protein
MNQSADGILTIAVLVLFLAGTIWIASVLILIRKLERAYPEMYHTMVEPRFQEYYTLQQIKSQTVLIKFIMKREHLALNDASLSYLCDFMRILFILYFVGFGALIVAIIIMRR